MKWRQLAARASTGLHTCLSIVSSTGQLYRSSFADSPFGFEYEYLKYRLNSLNQKLLEVNPPPDPQFIQPFAAPGVTYTNPGAVLPIGSAANSSAAARRAAARSPAVAKWWRRPCPGSTHKEAL